MVYHHVLPVVYHVLPGLSGSKQRASCGGAGRGNGVTAPA